MSLRQYTNWSRPAQPGTLVNLPAEVLMGIFEAIGNPDGPEAAEILHKLSQTCSRLYEIATPYFYRADNCRMFYHAVRLADIPMMNQCEYYNAAPVDMMWRRAPTQHVTAVNNLLTGLEEDSELSDDACQTKIHEKKLDNIFDALKWLLERGADGEATICHGRGACKEHPCGAVKRLGHMSTNLLKQLQRGSSKHSMEVIVNMIKLLSSYGYVNPTRPTTFAVQRLPYTRDDLPNTMWNYYDSSPLDLALKSHVAPSILELMLSEYADRGIKLKDWYDSCPPTLIKVARQEYYRGSSTKWSHACYIDKLIGTLYSDLHHEATKWEESYFGEVADIFQAKLKLMIKYEMVNALEEALLRSIGSALYSIAADGMQAGRYDEGQPKRSWEKLHNAVRSFANDGNLTERPWATYAPNGPGRVHRFAIDESSDPWGSWYRLQHGINKRAEGVEGRKLYPNVLYSNARRDDPDMPRWYTLDLDEWYDALPDI
ncbi:hypothetical protein HYE68_006865 [Fusarium pseudograminearum]|nr:hypothetical protein HYE68_006865 [Fusarium pseudograminearum]